MDGRNREEPPRIDRVELSLFARHSARLATSSRRSKRGGFSRSLPSTIAEQAEFGGVEAIDLLEGEKVLCHLYWWPFTDGVLVDKKGALVADLLDGTLTIEDAALRARVEAAYRAGPLPVTFRLA